MSPNLQRTICEYVKRNPRNIALQYRDKKITYANFYKKTRNLSEILKNAGVKKGDIVAICMSNSLELVISIYAVLFLGAVVLPIDIYQPLERIDTILDDSKPSLILYKSELKYSMGKYNISSILVEYEDLGSYVEKEEYIEISNDDPAFYMYTSGSTGIPKGVILYYKGILNHAQAKAQLISIPERAKICLSFNSGFVASIWQILVPILYGLKLVIYDNDLLKKPYQLFKRLSADKIAAISLTPSTLSAYMEYYKFGKAKITLCDLKYIILTGEKLSGKLVVEFYNQYSNIVLVNAYGQTECSDDTFHYVIPETFKGENVPIGIPIPNMNALVLNEDMRESKEGELYIEGIGVSSGYVNNMDLSKKKFVQLPYGKSLFYKTGDIVRKNDDCEYMYLGRIDNQIKLRGHRIEPEEIEANINQYDGIVQSIVTAIDTESGTKVLEVKYTSSKPINKESLQKYLSSKLPAYMIPSKYTRIEAFNLSPNGKIDRKNLPRNNEILDTNRLGNDDKFSWIYRKAFAIITKSIDKTVFTNISVDSNLSSLGIDSITFVRIIISLEEAFEIEFDDEMLLCDCFPNIHSLIKYVEEKVK